MMGMLQDNFKLLLLIARPGAGKSEIIDYLKKVPQEERQKRFHIAGFEEVDDFPMLWAWFEEDRLLEEMGQERLHSDEHGYFKWPHLWHLLVRRLCLEYRKKLRDDAQYHQKRTLLMEFSRGSSSGGYREAFKHISQQAAERMAILYVNVSWQESLRKNLARFNPDKPDSILQHGLSREKMVRLYRECDWQEVSAADPEHVVIQGVKVPYAVFENEDDVTTERGEALGQRLEAVLNRLWQGYLSARG